MSLISAFNISYSVSSKNLLENVSFSIERGARIALVGHNGSGKSSFLKILAASIEPDDGAVVYARGLNVALVEQFLTPDLENMSLWEAVALSQGHSGRDSSEDYLVDEVLLELGFEEHSFNQTIHSLSGGEVNRVLLARALIGKPDLLLLDEPTNHLDIAGVVQFEELLAEHINCAFCIVSHDRDLLDRCTDETFIIRDTRLHHFRLPLSRALDELRLADDVALRKRIVEEREIERLRSSASQLRYWASTFGNEKFASRARSIERRAQRRELEITQVPKVRRAAVSLASENLSARFLLHWESGSIDLGSQTSRLKITNFWIEPGERIAIVAPNGVGKSTLLRWIVDRFNQQRRNNQESGLNFNPRLKIGYYDQRLEILDNEETISEAIMRSCNLPEARVIKELVTAGFAYQTQQARVASLSGGERARLRLLSLKLQQPNLLLLDEPTNHLDLAGIEALECELVNSETTCLFVSHDRRFVARVATRLMTIKDKQLCSLDELA